MPADVWQAPDSEIDAIYHAQYWEPHCDALPGGLDCAFFDYNVNAGQTQAAKSLQRALGVTADGRIGIITSGAIAKANIPSLIHAYADRRRAFYRSLAQFSRYGNDWIGRTDRCEVKSESLVTTGTTQAPIPHPSPKADPADQRQPPVKPNTGVVVSGGAGGLAGLLHQLEDQLSPFVGSIHGLEYVLAGISVLVFAITLYSLWHQNQTQALAG